MDTCVVCWQSNEDVSKRLKTDSEEWKAWNIQCVIEKHLWWWYLRPENNKCVQWICLECWHALSSFHLFYNKVEKENKLHNYLSPEQKDRNKIDSIEVIKVEVQNDEILSSLSEDLVKLEKPKRGRKKKIVDSHEGILIETLPIVQVKFENDILEEALPKTELNADILLTDDIGNTDWEQCFFNESEHEREEEDQRDELGDDKLNSVLKKKNIMKVKTKAKSISKFRKKYTKTKKEKKVKVEKKSNGDSDAIRAMRKNDKYLADIEFQLSCCICTVSLENFNDLKSHFRKEHDTLGYAMCCNKKFYKRGVLIDHLNVHKDPEFFKCLQCNKALSTRRSYEKHMETHQLNETRQNLFTCETCEKSFVKKPVYDRHVLTHVPEEERNFQCNMCDKKFASEYLRKQHCTLTHKKKYAKICDICGKSLRDTFSFIRHMAEHKGETLAKVECGICGAQLTNKYRLNRHIKMMHTEENQQEQVCPYCSKVSPNLNAHRHHVKYTHTLERKHACNMCEKKFRRPLELKEHMSTHTGEPLYTCPHCPRTFISSANMHKHRKLTHRKEWEESRLKKEAKALAGKKFLKSLNALQNVTEYAELGILDPGTESVPNLSSIFC